LTQAQSLIEFGRWDTVAVFGEGGEAMNNPWTGGLTAPQFSAGDLDGDGVQDLFVFDRSGHRILPFQGCPSAVPESPMTYLYRPDWRNAFPEGIQNWALLRDANCDDVPDLFHNSQSGFRIWYGESTNDLVAYPEAPSTNVFGNWDFGTGDQQLPLICLNTDIPALDDFDGDGDFDYVVGNNGLNTKYETPALLYYGDVDGSGRKRILEAEMEKGKCFPIRGLSCSSNAMPFLRKKFFLS